MLKRWDCSIFIFRRDLRLDDNTALCAALEASVEVIPCFIFDPRQIYRNKYRSDQCLQFMIDSLRDLEGRLSLLEGKLYYFVDKPDVVVDRLICQAQPKINAVFCNRDYTPFSKDRDKEIEDVCKKAKVEFQTYDDCLLNPPGTVVKSSGQPYSVFTPYFNAARKISPSAPKELGLSRFYRKPLSLARESIPQEILISNNLNLNLCGGRIKGLELLDRISELKNYENERNFPALNKTSGLSAHNKFGTLSIREVYSRITATLGKDHGLVRELYWRDFFTQIAYFNPVVFGSEFRREFAGIHWNDNENEFNAWCEGQTGFPLVDAGMRQLNRTGIMHNRLRMICASFLVKDLHIDWRKGELYFARKLMDYDPAVNNGNWQWAASTGCDAQPYFRIFNPWIQQRKFDPNCEYIKFWVSELSGLSAKQIHGWQDAPLLGLSYPKPIVDHKLAAEEALSLFESAKLRANESFSNNNIEL